jgi:hypothetical protein
MARGFRGGTKHKKATTWGVYTKDGSGCSTCRVGTIKGRTADTALLNAKLKFRHLNKEVSVRQLDK